MKVVKAYIDQHRTNSSASYDIIVSRVLPDEPAAAAAMVEAFEEAGVTWLLRDTLPWEVPLSQAYTIVGGGPPRL